MPLELAVAIPTFVSSLLSLLATSAFAICYILFPPERHFRQALIVNLLISDWINSLNNSVSGAIALYRRSYESPLAPGILCTVNGYIGQWSVQATDFNILVISIAVLLTVTRSQITFAPPWWQVAIVCALPWIPGLITSNVALGLGIYGPVSGNWCWIKEDLVLRYTLTHGWRWLIFLSAIGIYTFIYIYLKRVYNKLFLSTSRRTTHTSGRGTTTVNTDAATKSIEVRRSICIIEHDEGQIKWTLAKSHATEETESNERTSTSTYDFSPPGPSQLYATQPTIPPSQRSMSISGEKKRERALRKMLLLNGYPLLYILLWIPGMANRVTEIVGTSPLWLRALACTTQLAGFANSLTYAWNESVFERIKSRCEFMRRDGRKSFVLPSREMHTEACL